MDYKQFSSDDEKVWSLKKDWKSRAMSMFDSCKLIFLGTLIILLAFIYMVIEIFLNYMGWQ